MMKQLVMLGIVVRARGVAVWKATDPPTEENHHRYNAASKVVMPMIKQFGTTPI